MHVAAAYCNYPQVWDFQVKERTLPLQQYARVLPAKGVYGGRVHAMHALVGHDGPLAVVRAQRRTS